MKPTTQTILRPTKPDVEAFGESIKPTTQTIFSPPKPDVYAFGESIKPTNQRILRPPKPDVEAFDESSTLSFFWHIFAGSLFSLMVPTGSTGDYYFSYEKIEVFA